MKVLAIILAGGKGTRLKNLVNDRCKPAVPFGGKYRIIDFVLSNCVNSNIRQIITIVQYKSDSLHKHIRDGWDKLSTFMGEYIDVSPPQQRVEERWFEGTADAIYQNLFTIDNENPDYVLVLSGDHIYKMNYWEMINYHRDRNSKITIATRPVPIEEGYQFGILKVNPDGRITEFKEKPANPDPMPGYPDKCLANMGIYVFDTEDLKKYLIEDAKSKDSKHDFGKDIIPKMIEEVDVFSFPFMDEEGNPRYWKDVGTVSAYYQAHMDLLKPDSSLKLNDPEWKIRTYQSQSSPVRVLKNGKVFRSLLDGGSIISGTINNSVLGSKINIGENAEINDSIIFNNVKIGKKAKIRRTILDKYVEVPDGYEIGYNLDEDRKKFYVSDENIVVISRNTKIQK
jgi:glucose-1-phosphate adenylyltransferase